MGENIVLEKDRHVLVVDEHQQINNGENGGFLIYDNKSKYFRLYVINAKVYFKIL